MKATNYSVREARSVVDEYLATTGIDHRPKLDRIRPGASLDGFINTLLEDLDRREREPTRATSLL